MQAVVGVVDVVEGLTHVIGHVVLAPVFLVAVLPAWQA